MPGPFEAVSTYFHAKDGNRPFLMRRAFTGDIHLEMVVKTEAISFPSSADGVAAIEEILSRGFANDFENVYTFCLAQPTEANRRHFPCHWLVGMSAKNNGPIRVGSGRYDWYFTRGAQCKVEKLVITIDVMQIFPADKLDRIMGWITNLPYPWCEPGEMMREMPRLEGLAPIQRYLKEIRPIPPER
ncbi:MAG: hypothetical protein EOS58_16165 [Mesorhizobium sp.]|uniref:hypothetical protein n=1 Tax=unclassified Mesorhizobium TaxID=325217 RepID=UPI000F752FED|nr:MULTISPECIES: hypothetical protein [unclassified Mesorhizobium]AZO46841.1 hypothetical protein EJ073_02720 [Mesorhizobium sp. M4B.F.Ca.ET.058.02.1.1]RVC43069.1 hypothetical protein EN781_19750 [Mesorhizobium sp. M4A.F.Ca.ET.090.04.2.1]RWC37347.1 MAG: hypothetical protein EOS54_30630 [Mesorhizobium sp.]RWD03603.1 MAG: hypothetical protein EOS58_16165 [Mesorhizobium sp.]RWD11005.1 MAG: hypothetical protein EOS74_28320 [Mesorhizobium sp.]